MGVVLLLISSKQPCTWLPAFICYVMAVKQDARDQEETERVICNLICWQKLRRASLHCLCNVAHQPMCVIVASHLSTYM